MVPNRTNILRIVLSAMLLASCTNSRLQPSNLNQGDETDPGSGGTPVAYRISDVTMATGSSSSSAASSFSVFFDSSSIPAALTESCSTQSNNSLADKPCLCQFSWKQVNPFSPVSSPVPRLIYTEVKSVQANMVLCTAPEIFSQDNELPVGTTLKIQVIPGPSNPAKLVTSVHEYTKTAGTVADASFQDAQGRYFDDILRYTCFEQFQRGMTITNKTMAIEGGADGQERVNVPLASQFCISKAGAAAGGVQNCPTTPPKENSAQAYYYNLYTRESEVGGLNYSNQRYVCPKVKEPLIAGMGPNHHWPLDSSFALSLGPTPEFPIGVEAFTKLANGAGDQGTQGSVCYPPQGAGNDEGNIPVTGNTSIVKSCLGFAAKPNPDGTCPYFKDSNGRVRHTFRLRRFVALYPALFDTTGAPVQQAHAIDTIYVLDRPVLFSGGDENKPYTMRGPKPCPFAFFDHKSVLGEPDSAYPGQVKPIYAGTNESRWKGKNVDGIQLPNTDSVNSCAAALPLLNDDMTILSIATVHKNNPKYPYVYIRPTRPWSPHYVEDTDFLACAPQSNTMRDPPLHFAKDATTGNVSWCAEAYPTQNDNVAFLDKRKDTNTKYYGKVQPFTSHVVKHSASTDCEFKRSNVTFNTSTYPDEVVGATCPAPNAFANPSALAFHPGDLVIDKRIVAGGGIENVCAKNTCDRTVANQSLTWAKFPLLAPPKEVEKTLSSDTTYGCVITYDNGGGKTGTKTPSEGCCGFNVSVWTGIPDQDETDPKLTNSGAHLEPDQRCLIPKY